MCGIVSVRMCFRVVHSLNSPFFLAPTGPEPYSGLEERRFQGLDQILGGEHIAYRITHKCRVIYLLAACLFLALIASGFNVLQTVNLGGKKPGKCSNVAADSVAPNGSAN